ncbi:MAG: coproporphyrinogen dehydrogenase HemZ [Ruminococcus sp.]
MKLYIKNHNFHYEMENLIRLFFPNEKITVIKEIPDCPESPCVYTETDKEILVSVNINGFAKSGNLPLTDDEIENERRMAQLIFEFLTEYTGVKPPWGILTGVRPVKLFRRLMEEEGLLNAVDHFRNKFFVSNEKIVLARRTEAYEKEILSLSDEKSFSLYISIPFCPSRCKYCSFVMQSIERTKHLVEPYVDLLCKELEHTAEIAKALDLRLETVYMGGGTPTTLSALQLERVLKTVSRNFDLSKCREITVEAGRPDTITMEKLVALKENNVNRISINPQTLNDSVLEVIGRKHSSEQTLEAYALAQKVGFESINMDLIAGLPTDSLESFCETLDKVCQLNPQCVTVHTLSMKRSSTLTEEGVKLDTIQAEETAKMLEYAEDKLSSSEYIPYYLYRQSRMAGNLENVGWSKRGNECLYNVFVMDETHTILACGAGAVTKLKSPSIDYLERIFNFKYPYEYISRFDEILQRKNIIPEFYKKYF